MVIIRNPDNVVTLGVSQPPADTTNSSNSLNAAANGAPGNHQHPVREGPVHNANNPPMVGGLEIEGGPPHGDEEFVPALGRPRNIMPWWDRRPGVPGWLGNTSSQYRHSIYPTNIAYQCVLSTYLIMNPPTLSFRSLYRSW